MKKIYDVFIRFVLFLTKAYRSELKKMNFNHQTRLRMLIKQTKTELALSVFILLLGLMLYEAFLPSASYHPQIKWWALSGYLLLNLAAYAVVAIWSALVSTFALWWCAIIILNIQMVCPRGDMWHKLRYVFSAPWIALFAVYWLIYCIGVIVPFSTLPDYLEYYARTILLNPVYIGGALVLKKLYDVFYYTAISGQ